MKNVIETHEIGTTSIQLGIEIDSDDHISQLCGQSNRIFRLEFVGWSNCDEIAIIRLVPGNGVIEVEEASSEDR